jgi:Tfp pilus assembly protein PilP
MSARVLRFATKFTALIAVVIVAGASLVAQTPPPPATDTATATAGGASVQQTLEEILEDPAGGETYRYDPQGRRDPFQSLVGPTPKIQPGQRPPGVPGFLIDEMKLQGIVQTRQGPVGMISGPDNKGYLIRVGDKVLDGEVIRITPSTVVFRMEVNDPTRIERYREVVKDLTPPSQRR